MSHYSVALYDSKDDNDDCDNDEVDDGGDDYDDDVDTLNKDEYLIGDGR